MEGVFGKFFFTVRLFVLLLFISCLSPGPDARQTPASVLYAKLASISGELRIVIQKSRYVLTIYKGMTPVKSYWAVFGKGYRGGDKLRRGDKRTPEGEFYICSLNHSERFYKFMGISYPGVRHAEYGFQNSMITASEYNDIINAIQERRQPPWDTRLGGAVGIHGRMLANAVRPVPHMVNWTDGCIALNNEDVDELYSVVGLGTPVHILP